MEIYQQTCFRLYDLPINERAKYIKIDRHKLKYLNPLEKFNCMYCSYVNGVFEYSKKIAADSEKYWCGIQHQKSENYISPSHHKDFLEYGDKDSFMILREKQTAQISAEQKLPNEAK